jgi:hypothetical protein
MRPLLAAGASATFPELVMPVLLATVVATGLWILGSAAVAVGGRVLTVDPVGVLGVAGALGRRRGTWAGD